MVNAFRLFYASIWRNMLVMMRYRVNFILDLITNAFFGICILIVSLVFKKDFLTNIIGSTGAIPFLILGIGFFNFQDIALWGASGLLQGELITGQIDYIFSCPCPRYRYIISNITALAVQQIIKFLPVFLIGILAAQDTLSSGGIGLGLAAVLLSVAALSQMGACFGAMALRFQQISALFQFFNVAFQFGTGMLVPLHVFPVWMRWLGLLAFPQSAGMDLLRHYIVDSRPLIDVTIEWAILAGQFLILGLIAQLTVKYLDRSARERGLHYL